MGLEISARDVRKRRMVAKGEDERRDDGLQTNIMESISSVNM